MLLGERIEKRPAEKIGMRMSKWLAPLMAGRLRKYRPIEARIVAQAMIGAARQSLTGLHIHEYDSIRELAHH
jgi:hypothetical protein